MAGGPSIVRAEPRVNPKSSAIGVDAIEDAKVMRCGPGTAAVASTASRSEMPSGPGLLASSAGLPVLPLTTSLVVVTTTSSAKQGIAERKPAKLKTLAHLTANEILLP